MINGEWLILMILTIRRLSLLLPTNSYYQEFM
jgi:hypothetical protein